MSINIGWPEGLYLALNFVSLALCAGKGEIRATVGGSLMIWIFVTLPLLWWGGFFA